MIKDQRRQITQIMPGTLTGKLIRLRRDLLVLYEGIISNGNKPLHQPAVVANVSIPIRQYLPQYVLPRPVRTAKHKELLQEQMLQTGAAPQYPHRRIFNGFLLKDMPPG